MADKPITPEVRRIETTYTETGVGQTDRTDVTYELGAEIDGTWVTFASVAHTVLEAVAANAAANAAAASTDPSQTEGA